MSSHLILHTIKHISSFGEIVQWLERVHGKEEVIGSNPTRPNFLNVIEKTLAHRLSSPRLSYLVFGLPPSPLIEVSTSSASSYLKPSDYDHVHITFNGLQVI